METPIPNSYWVVPGKFLAGEYPRNLDEASSIPKVQALLQVGVSYFLDLTEEDEGLYPYQQILDGFGDSNITHKRFPIRDNSIPAERFDMSSILDAIDKVLAEGGMIYLHCWGGIGRTGTAVGCWLARHGFEGDWALKKLRDLWQHCAKSSTRQSPETREQEKYILEWREHNEQADRYLGCLLGLAVGDALGTTLEFKSPGSFTPIHDMIGGGPFRLQPGEWTDDTSMALCLAESLMHCSGFDPEDQIKRYIRWMEEGYLSSTGTCFDIGNTVSAALYNYKKTGKPYSGSTDSNSAGNGSIMRLAPIPMYFASDPAKAINLSGESSKTTHGTKVCVDACRYMGALIVGALNGEEKDALLSPFYAPVPQLWDDAPFSPDISEIAGGSFKEKEPPEIAGTGYVIKSLEAALWAFYKSSSFEEGCLLAVNLGDDADTTGAVYGQIAGAFYGRKGIPDHWLSNLVMQDEMQELAGALQCAHYFGESSHSLLASSSLRLSWL